MKHLYPWHAIAVYNNGAVTVECSLGGCHQMLGIIEPMDGVEKEGMAMFANASWYFWNAKTKKGPSDER